MCFLEMMSRISDKKVGLLLSKLHSKAGVYRVYIILLNSGQKHRLWHSLEPPRRGGSNEYPQSMF